MRLNRLIIIPCLLLIGLNSYATTNAEKTAQYFESIKTSPTELTIFLQDMPVGGDIHHHASGAYYAENLLRYGINEDFCINPKTTAAYKSPNCPPQYKIKNVLSQPALYDRIIDAWSLRHFPLTLKSGENHFFKVFPLLWGLVSANIPDVVAGAAKRAQQEHELYLETMISGHELNITDSNHLMPADVGKKVGPQTNLTLWRKKLLEAGLNQIIEKTDKKVNGLNTQVKQKLKCGTDQADPACQLTIRYQYFAFRDIPLPQFYAELLTAFGVADKNPSVVGINIVQPENWKIALRDYTKQMRMIAYLHTVYPKVNITLHAGELAFGQVPPKDLTFHIRQAIEIAHAQRIGHGVSIIYEKNARQLLNEMRKKDILVEINLTSNADILKITGKNHPLPLYVKYGVPVTLSTDDEGVERTDLKNEYKRAVLTYGFSYPILKRFARNSIAYSFLPGKNLWKNRDNFIPVDVCASDDLGSKTPSKLCSAFLKGSEKARMEWKLERQFKLFEKEYARI